MMGVWIDSNWFGSLNAAPSMDLPGLGRQDLACCQVDP
ncbi:hypothetical protein BN381_580001 [Candidatus Microthrix parvicella RN1]|uniref:Uncharacterized protein n=1 Tax=Candidatus Neomicrothrix parvicella RN1 TaxID=1229780 RepID=R4Z2B7_9ACTN|nr:hypothetical protein BN381_580001 [Candidatus Microthrix parvicella RN1]